MLLLAILPLVVSLSLISLAVLDQERELIAREHALVQQAYLDARHSELRNYVALAASTIQPLYERGGNDAADRQQALRLLASLDYGPDGYFFVYDLNGEVLMHSRQPELIGQNLWSLEDPLGRLTIQRLIAQASAGGGFVEYLWPRPSTGQIEEKLGYVIALERWHWMVGTGLYLGGIHATLGELETRARDNITATLLTIAGIAGLAVGLIFVAGLALNLSEHRSAETRLRLLARQVQQSQEDERARLARELHDGVSQTLVSTKLLVEVGAETGQTSLLQRAVGHLNQSLAEIRAISHRLRPTLLDTLGLPAALQHLGREVAEAAGLAIAVRFIDARAGAGTAARNGGGKDGGGRDGGGNPAAPGRSPTDSSPGGGPGGPTDPVGIASVDLPPLADEAKTALFRIAQEALTNVTRHAGASRVDIVLKVEADGGLVLAISDDGRGFDIDAMQRDPEKGIGLRNMRERLAAIGGEFQISSTPGKGTWIRAQLPPNTGIITAPAGRDPYA